MIKLLKQKTGQVFIAVILLSLGFIMFILAAPLLFEIIGVGVAGTGTATSFFMRAYPFVIAIILIGIFLKIISSGESFL